MISTKEKFRKGDVMELRESKTEMSKPLVAKAPLHELRKPEREKSKFGEQPVSDRM